MSLDFSPHGKGETNYTQEKTEFINKNRAQTLGRRQQTSRYSLPSATNGIQIVNDPNQHITY